MLTNNVTKIRQGKIDTLKELNQSAYGQNFNKTDLSSFINEEFDYLKPKEKLKNINFSIIGRIKVNKNMGNNAFVYIEDEEGIVQVFISKEELKENFFVYKKTFDIGDIVNISGFVFKTRDDKISLFATEVKMVTKALSPSPDILTDLKTKYRQRYLDMIVNKDIKTTLIQRSKIVSTIRRYFEDRDFVEVETPMLNSIPGGANAKPFVTHHNSLGVNRYLRIAPELYLKRLIVGGIDTVFEIGKNFRNEGIDSTHNPEFTSLEFYWAYQNYEFLIETLIELLSLTRNALDLPDIVPYGDKEVDFTDVKIITFRDALIDIGCIPEEIVEKKKKIVKFLKEKDIQISEGLSKGKLWEILFDNFVEDELINPTFITEYPIEISPLARAKDDNPKIAERFELFVAGTELANGFNELNDPKEQYKRFKKQVKLHGSDDEAMHLDEDYIEALKYGLPPTAGAGLGIDRLVMLLTNNTSIKDVIAFPAIK
jgi:lysyl-tRNA synthetase, class II